MRKLIRRIVSMSRPLKYYKNNNKKFFIKNLQIVGLVLYWRKTQGKKIMTKMLILKIFQSDMKNAAMNTLTEFVYFSWRSKGRSKQTSKKEKKNSCVGFTFQHLHLTLLNRLLTRLGRVAFFSKFKDILCKMIIFKV